MSHVNLTTTLHFQSGILSLEINLEEDRFNSTCIHFQMVMLNSSHIFSLARIEFWAVLFVIDFFLGYMLAIDMERSVGLWSRGEKQLYFNHKTASLYRWQLLLDFSYGIWNNGCYSCLLPLGGAVEEWENSVFKWSDLYSMLFSRCK